MSAAGSSTGWTRAAEASAQVPRQVQIVQRSAFSMGGIVIHVGAGGKRAKEGQGTWGADLPLGVLTVGSEPWLPAPSLSPRRRGR